MKKRLLCLALSVIVVSACSPLTGSELAKNRERWQLANISRYRFSLSVACFCAFSQRMPLTLEVAEDQIVSMTYNDGTPVPEDERKIFEPYATINALFTFTENAISQADEIHIQYDPVYGFPSEVQIDYIKNAVDDELALSVRGFEPLQ